MVRISACKHPGHTRAEQQGVLIRPVLIVKYLLLLQAVLASKWCSWLGVEMGLSLAPQNPLALSSHPNHDHHLFMVWARRIFPDSTSLILQNAFCAKQRAPPYCPSFSSAPPHHLHLLSPPLDGERMWSKSVVSSEKGSQSTVTPEVWKNTGKTQEEHGNDTGRTWDEPLGRKMIGQRDCLEIVFTLPCLAAVWCQSCVSENNMDTHSNIAPDLWEKKERERYCLQLSSLYQLRSRCQYHRLHHCLKFPYFPASWQLLITSQILKGLNIIANKTTKCQNHCIPNNVVFQSLYQIPVAYLWWLILYVNWDRWWITSLWSNGSLDDAKKSVLDIISICINSIQIKKIIFYNVDDFI